MTINLKVLKLNTFYIKLFTNNVGPTAIGYPNGSSDLKNTRHYTAIFVIPPKQKALTTAPWAVIFIIKKTKL